MARYAYKRMSQPRKISLPTHEGEARVRKRRNKKVDSCFLFFEWWSHWIQAEYNINRGRVLHNSRCGYFPNNKQTSKTYFSSNSTVRRSRHSLGIIIYTCPGHPILFLSCLALSVYVCPFVCRRRVELRRPNIFSFFRSRNITISFRSPKKNYNNSNMRNDMRHALHLLPFRAFWEAELFFSLLL